LTSGQENERTGDNGKDIPYHRGKPEHVIYAETQPGAWNMDGVVQDMRKHLGLYFFPPD
jgi:hypothetical protein